MQLGRLQPSTCVKAPEDCRRWIIMITHYTLEDMPVCSSPLFCNVFLMMRHRCSHKYMLAKLSVVLPKLYAQSTRAQTQPKPFLHKEKLM